MSATVKRPLPRLALDKKEAAASIGMGISLFEDEVYPHLDVVRCNSKVLIPVSELERWLEENKESLLTEAERKEGKR